MTIAELHPAIKEIQTKHHIYGLECILMEVARSYRNELYVDKDWLLDLFAHCIDRVSLEVNNEN